VRLTNLHLIPVIREFKGTFVNRKGITLLEVLMAIFIMGIGMVSVFAIFPVAALMMGQAIEKYQINEVVNNAQSNFDPDAMEFVKNQPNWIYSGGSVLNPALNGASPQYLFLDQAAGPSKTLLGGVIVAYVNGGVSPMLPAQINERYFTSNFDIELDESGRAVTPVSSIGRYSVSFLLEKKSPLDNPLPSRRYMLVYKGRSQTFADFPLSLATLSANTGNAIIVANSAFSDACKKNDWVMVVNSLSERTFHQIQNINGTELELRQKFGSAVTNGVITIQGVYLLSDVVRVIDMGAG
jgi:prepilin-type N-terminal cleavage/methylation domain-containing protein